MTNAQLALMPLPLSSLGPAASALPLSPDSGVQSNSAAASNTNKLTTAKTFARLGRITGYQLDYSDPTFAALGAGHGLIDVDTEVDLYKSPTSASAGLAFKQKDDLSVQGLRSSMLGVTASIFAPAKVGESRYGLNGVLKPVGIGSLYACDVNFQEGSLVASVSITAADPTGIQAVAASLAARLDARIAAVRSGKVAGAPVPLPAKAKAGRPPHGPDLAKLTLGPADLGTAKVTHQGYELDNDLKPVSEYVRRMSPAGAFAFLESEVALFHTPAQARFTAALLIDTLASKQALRQSLGTNFGGVPVTNIIAKPVRIEGSDQPYALLITMKLANGTSFSAAFTAVHVDKAMEFMTVFATPGQTLHTAPIANVVKAAAKRLSGHVGPGIVA